MAMKKKANNNTNKKKQQLIKLKEEEQPQEQQQVRRHRRFVHPRRHPQDKGIVAGMVQQGPKRPSLEKKKNNNKIRKCQKC
ncbi:hypothetical protein REPUB_Repub17cG0041900 [Reevesia pubescens]